MIRVLSRHLVIVLLAALFAACNGAEQKGQPVTGAKTAIELRIMSFNIEWGGTNISFDKVVEAIRRADADIVGIQEAEGNLQRLAADLGWHYDLRNYVISRYPVIDPPGADGRYVYVEVDAGRVVAIANVHLPSDPYGPDAVRDGATPAAVVEIERRTRLRKIEPYLSALSPLLAKGIPVFMSGDFNAPAHADWTAEAVGTRPFLPYALDWPVSRAVVAAGFHDSWRDVYPDPVAHPGLSWWAGRPPLELYSPGENDPRDRIDFVWFAGPVTVQTSQLVGEQGAPEVSISVMPWPSDHRGVVSQFTAVPASMPDLISTGRRVYRIGEDIDVVWHNSRNPAARVSVTSLDEDRKLIAWRQQTESSRMVFNAGVFTPGHYGVSMQGADPPLQREFWVLPQDAKPFVEVIGSSFEPGEAIGIRWRNAPGNRNDYVAVYPADRIAAYENGLAWTYLDARPAGQVQLDADSAEWGWPLAPGRYVIRLLKDDGYEQLAASAQFSVE